MPVKFNLILAKEEKNGIGLNGKLPWTLKKEMAYFQRMTKTVKDPRKKNAVIMGRNTWEESMPDAYKPLPGRLNFVLSSKAMQLKGDAIHCYNLQEVVEKLSSNPLADQIETSWVIGGAKLYESVLAENLGHRIYITNIKKLFPCDTFVNLDLQGFSEIHDDKVPRDIQEENGIQYEYKVYERNII